MFRFSVLPFLLIQTVPRHPHSPNLFEYPVEYATRITSSSGLDFVPRNTLCIPVAEVFAGPSRVEI